MEIRTGRAWLVIALGLCGLQPLATAQRGVAVNGRAPDSCAGGNPSAMLTVHAAQSAARYLNLCDGHALGAGLVPAGHAQPLSLASADFDEDGVPDLVSGYAAGKGGLVTVHRGNVNALWPYGVALRNGPPPAFFPAARTINLPEAPDFIATGDFDADGHWDIVTAQRGSNALYFLRGDGHGGFGSPQRFPLPGAVTAMIAGEINRPDGLTDLMVAVNSADGPKVLAFESPLGALKGQPETFQLPHPGTDLTLGRFDGTPMVGLAVAAGNQVVVIHGRDRRLSLGPAERARVAPAQVTLQSFPFSIQAVAAGDFTGVGPSIAALGNDGIVHILEHSITLASLGPLADPDFIPTFQTGKPGPDGKPLILAGTMSRDKRERYAALRKAAEDSANSAEWTEKSTVALPSGFSQTFPRLVAARLTGSKQQDILAIDSGNSKIHVLSAAGMVRSSLDGSDSIGSPAASIRLLDSLEATSAPAAVLPMRLSPHGLSGLVILQAGQAVPTIMPQVTPPANVFTVINTLDLPVTASLTIPPGSLRAALANAGTAWEDNGEAGNYSIVFNIPTTDPGYNPSTGTFLIQPLSAEAPGLSSGWAYGPNNATVVLDGYTQPGASPNTLAIGDNAKILIQIDGALATTPGGSGLVAGDVGSTYRGMALTGWTNYQVAGGDQFGADGIAAGGVGDYFEGIFFGTDTSGKVAAPNEVGIFDENSPGLGSTANGNVIGGTTPQARNILSGNTGVGALFLAIADESQLEGNYVGVDATGAAPLANGNSGVGLNGPEITIGGTLPGAGNVISGNSSNVDINDLTNEYQASDSTVQGNLIGTDLTGTHSVASGSIGVQIVHNPEYMLIGGTTPAARNVISGNVYGVYLFDEVDLNTVQGNYIGVDITGVKAAGNSEQGIITGTTTTTNTLGAVDNFIGGDVPGAGNVISGNGLDGIQIFATGYSQNGGTDGYQGQTIQGNFIGTDSTGKIPIPNNGNGIYLTTGASVNLIGGNTPGAGNLIANNVANGVLIDPGTATAGEGLANNTVANTILSNGGAGVRVNSGSQDLISQNSIFGNGALGINLDGLGPNINTNCQSTITGPNNSQNAPVLTAGTGAGFITATATDPSNNTSEFSKAVEASTSGNTLSLLGTFNGLASTTYTIEFFSSTTADPSGYGQGQTYLGNTTVTTDASCNAAVNNPVKPADADLSVTLTDIGGIYGYGLIVGPDFGNQGYVGAVTNNGPATAHNVVFTDDLPSQLEISSAYCDVGPCQSPVVSSLGSCTEHGNTVTCNLGTMAPGASATLTVPVQTLDPGSIKNTVTVSATETDPNPANNTASLTETAGYPLAQIDHFEPASTLAGGSSNLLLTIYGYGLLPDTAVTFNGASLPIAAFLDNQGCPGPSGSPVYCAAIQVVVPASMLATAGTPTLTVANPGATLFGTQPTYTVAASCTFTNFSSLPVLPSTEENDGYIEIVSVESNVQSCPWTATSSVPWATIMVPTSGTGDGGVNIAIAPNTDSAPRTGSVTVAGQTFSFQQDPGATCTYALGSTSATIPAAGGPETFAVTGTCPNEGAQQYVTWITIPLSSQFINGDGTVTYTVDPNTGPPRTGAIAVDNVALNVTQSAPSCYFTLDTSSTNLPAAGGTGSINVTASLPSCAWTATPSNSSLISITSGGSGIGNGTVKYSVPANTEGPQSGTITIGTQTGFAVFSVQEASAFNCTFSLSPATVQMPASGGTNYFVVKASYQTCSWTAAPSDPANLAITFNPSGTGNSAVFYSVSQNTGAPRTLTITAGCQTFIVNQDGTATTNPVPVISTLAPAGSTAGSPGFTLTVNGSSFINGSVVNFNGTALVTTYVNANQLTAVVPASLVVTASKPPVTVFNPTPGGGTSNAVDFNITVAGKITPTLTVTPSPLSIKATQALSVSVTVNGGTGNPTPTGSVTLTSGSYTSAAITLSGGTATINIPAGSLVAGTDTLTVSYTPDSGSSSTYNAATGSNTVTVTSPAKITPTLTVAPSPASITTAQALSVKVTVNGGTGNPTPTGSITLASGSYTSAAATLSGGSATINIPAGSLAAGTDSLTASYTPDSASLSTYNSAAGSNTVAVTAASVQVTVGTSPAGLSFSVDGTSYTTMQTLTWTAGASHTIATTSPQNAAGTQDTFVSWSDGGALSHSVTAPSSATSYTANFTTSYQLTTAASPVADGTVTPASGSYYASGTVVNLKATPDSGFQFTSWTGSVASASSASTTVTMSAPESVTANFVVGTAPVAMLTPSLGFTSTTVGTTSSAMVATLSNSGNATLNLSSIALGGANPTDFAVTTGTNACGATLAADASCSIYVTFTPAAAQGYSATLTVTDNATPATQSTALTGAGTPAPAPIATLAPSTLTFTAVSGTTTAAQTVMLSNTGNATLNIGNITIGGSNPSDFAETNTCGETLAFGSSCNISVTFTPASVAGFSASLQVTDNASGSPQPVTLTGTGAPPPSFTISSNSGAQTIQSGGTATYTITVTPQNGAFSNAVAFSATGLPTGATGTFTPPSITPGSAPATSTLTIQTGTTTTVASRPNAAWPLAVPALALVSLLFLPGKRRRRWITLALLLFASFGAFTALTACGGGFSLNQQSQNYTITVTGTSGADVQTTTVQLTVK